jgi:Protein of unknown function (DUF2408)
VDKALDDCFQLISLFYLTIGKNNEAPAVFAFTSTVKRLLDHLHDAPFSAKDIDSVLDRLSTMRTIIHRGKDSYSPHLLQILETRVNHCEELTLQLRDSLKTLSPRLAPLHEKLISILRSTSAASTKTKFATAELKAFEKQLDEIEKTEVNGKFVTADGSIPEGQEIVLALLDRCQRWVAENLERKGQVDEGLKPIYNRLLEIRNDLEKLSLTQAWSLRETDLYMYQRELDSIDEARQDGKFIGTDGKPGVNGQTVSLIAFVRIYLAFAPFLIRETALILQR